MNTTQVFLSIRLERLLDGKSTWLPRQGGCMHGSGNRAEGAAARLPTLLSLLL